MGACPGGEGRDRTRWNPWTVPNPHVCWARHPSRQTNTSVGKQENGTQLTGSMRDQVQNHTTEVGYTTITTDAG
eukprot:scaffold1771_cov343-Pavlova_lutheri.AAC.13